MTTAATWSLPLQSFSEALAYAKSPGGGSLGLSSGVTIIFGPQQTFATNGEVRRQGCEIPVHSLITVLIHNSGHFRPPLPFWDPGPPGIAGAADG